MDDRTREGDDLPTWASLADWNNPPSAPPATAPAPTPPPFQQWGSGGNGKKRPVRPWGKIAVAVGLVLALAAGGFVYLSLNRSSGSTALAFSLTPGNTLRYGLHMNMAGKLTFQGRTVPFTMNMDETFSWKVDSVDAQGVATVDMKLEKVSGTVDGQTIPSTGTLHTKIRLAKDGRILTAGELTATGGNSFAQLPGSDQLTPLLPGHPVKPGDTWTKAFSQAFPLGSGAINYSSTNTFERYEVVDGVKTAVIHSTMSAPLSITLDFRKLLALSGQDRALPRSAHPTVAYGGKVSSNQTAWFDPKAGQMVKGTGQGRFDLSMRFKGFPVGMGQPQGAIGFAGTMSFSIERQT